MNDGFVEQDARGVMIGGSVEAEHLCGWPGRAAGLEGYLSTPIDLRAPFDLVER